MKIIKEGRPKRYWPYDETWVCRNCGAEFEVEEGDAPLIQRIPDAHPDDAQQQAIYLCPTPGCGTDVVVYDYRDGLR